MLGHVLKSFSAKRKASHSDTKSQHNASNMAAIPHSNFIRAGNYGININNIVYFNWEEDLSYVCIYLQSTKNGKTTYQEFNSDEGAQGILKALHKLTFFASKYTDRKSAGNPLFICGGRYAFALSHVTHYTIDEPSVTLYFDVESEDAPTYLEFNEDESGPKIIKFLQDDSPSVL